MAFDYIHTFDLCQKCKKVSPKGQQNYIDPNLLEQGTRLAILSLSKKTLCLGCINQVMLEAFKKGGEVNVPADKMPMRERVETSGPEQDDYPPM